MTTRYADLAQVDAVIIAVPTPLTENREPDLQPLISSGTALAGVLQEGQLVVLESTTYPGTTRDRLAPLLEESGLRAGRSFNLAFSPERIDPGRTDFTLRTTPKVVGGLTPACLKRAVDLYSAVCDEVVPVSTPEIAEMTKLLENIFRTVNIALVNELAMLCDRMQIDVWEVVRAAATKPYGFMSFSPGPGMGGHCLPVDPFYLAWKAREYDMQTEFIELAGEVNAAMPYYCADKVAKALNDQAKPVRGSRVAILGVSYKAGVGDLRESPALKIMSLLAEQGAELSYHDSFVPGAHPLRTRVPAARRRPPGRRRRGHRHGASGPRRRARRVRRRGRRGLPRRDRPGARRQARRRQAAGAGLSPAPTGARRRGSRPR